MINTEQYVFQFRENLELIRKSYQAYQEKLEGRSCHLGLSNGESIFLNFTNAIVAHLLGLQFSYLQTHPLFANKTSFECLLMLFEETDLIEAEIRKRSLNIFLMFSSFIKKKSLSLQKIPPLDRNFLQEIVFVCPYKKDIAMDHMESSSLETDYIIGIRSSENDMNLLGVIKEQSNSDKHFFTINSNLIVENDENYFQGLENIIGYQTLTYPTHMNLYVCDDLKQSKLYFLKNEDKLSRIRNLEYYVEKLNIKIDTLGETKRQLTEVIKHKDNCSQNNSFYKLLIDCFDKKQDTDEIDYSNLNPTQIELLYLVRESISRCENAEFTLHQIMENINHYSKQKEYYKSSFHKK